MKLFLPTLGTRIVLSKPWAFKLKDERGNEKWWTAVHGQPPQRTPYFYGYDQATGKYMTSPTQTPICNRSAEHPAPPQATVLPKGATLLVEQVYIRKGLREYDSLTFRIAKGDPTGVPSGKFSVPLSQVNGKLEGVADLPTKYPKGKNTNTAGATNIRVSAQELRPTTLGKTSCGRVRAKVHATAVSSLWWNIIATPPAKTKSPTSGIIGIAGTGTMPSRSTTSKLYWSWRKRKG